MMNSESPLVQSPPPETHLLRFCGDTCTLVLTADRLGPGRAFVRTNLGRAHTRRREIIGQVEFDQPLLGKDWFDIPMTPAGGHRYTATLPLYEVGHFEAKCLFIADHQDRPQWPAGGNVHINVEPAGTCCANIIYNAFVRQFGPDKHKERARSDVDPHLDTASSLEQEGFTVIPASGTFRDLIAELDFILGRLGCRVLQLLPIHPTPTTYARMGRYGSPYAALSFRAVDPALAVFDPRATPLEQFGELVDAVHARNGKIVIDMAINHTGWAASLHESHPHWLARRQDGQIENPGAWGVVWEDLTRLDYRHRDLWQYMADIFLTWCRRQVDGFRCDAGYMIPTNAWRYIISRVREQFPDTIFFLEGLGGKISVTRDLLNRANFNWAYSELFQNNDRRQIEHYLPGANRMAEGDGLTVHFAETHDNDRLAATSTVYARMRTALCALLAPNGGFGFANGVEWLANEKISVHEPSALNWGAEDNQVAAVAHLNRLLRRHPCFGADVEMDLVTEGSGPGIAYQRRHRPTGQAVTILANLDTEHPTDICWRHRDDAEGPWYDLLTKRQVTVETTVQSASTHLAAGQVRCLAQTPVGNTGDDNEAPCEPPAALHQRRRAKVLAVMAHFLGMGTIEDAQIDPAAGQLAADPLGLIGRFCPSSSAPPVVRWHYPHDLNRQVMIPPGHFLLVAAPCAFQMCVEDHRRVMGAETSMPDRGGAHFALMMPTRPPAAHRRLELQLTVHPDNGASRHETAELLQLANPDGAQVRKTFSRQASLSPSLMAMDTNGRGAMLRAHADANHLASRYDALLAANLNPDFPEDRRVLLSRLRAWIVFQDFSQPLGPDSLLRFGQDERGGIFWRYQIHTGQGQHLMVTVSARLRRRTANSLQWRVYRHLKTGTRQLEDHRPVTLIVRPDIEDRNFHDTTKAFAGPENAWPSRIESGEKGFRFHSDTGSILAVEANEGHWTAEPQWQYSIHRCLEAERGLDPDSDLFSPGYFSMPLAGGNNAYITARVITASDGDASYTPSADQASGEDERRIDKRSVPFERALRCALDHFIVSRGEFRTIIAGYPWFLDWGRDTLIVVRGLIAAGRLAEAEQILIQFARFERNGTLPNMIRGDNADNRDTSDAPLWLLVACADLMDAGNDGDFLDRDCGGRTLKQVQIDLASALIRGTDNGISMDPESGLIFSPAHFTWMDTNHPAGTPRQGYPIDIQALWFAATRWLARIDDVGRHKWTALARKIQASIDQLFWQPELGFLSDCRHADPGCPAHRAVADDALRPNQLLAITLGAVTDKRQIAAILDACAALLVPGAIRSLADRPVKHPLPIHWRGHALNDPHHPYWGHYTGDEDTRRKPAYHNGTAWTWLFPAYCEAWVNCYGKAGLDAGRAWLTSAIDGINNGCIGQVSEILDGNAPHEARGCDAQAWGASELLRVWLKLKPS